MRTKKQAVKDAKAVWQALTLWCGNDQEYLAVFLNEIDAQWKAFTTTHKPYDVPRDYGDDTDHDVNHDCGIKGCPGYNPDLDDDKTL